MTWKYTRKGAEGNLVVVMHTYITALIRLRQEDQRFKASVSYIHIESLFKKRDGGGQGQEGSPGKVASATKLDDLGLSPMAYTVEGENRLFQVVF